MSLLKNGWVVKNAVNRDVERQHLNKILAEIREELSAVSGTAGGGYASDIQAVVGRMVDGNTETGIAVDYDAARRVLNFVVSNFIIRLSGDVTGQGEVNGLQSVTIPVTIDPSKVGLTDAPVDGQAYWRRDGAWQATGTALDQLQYFGGGGIAVLDFGGEWHARIIDGTDGDIEVENGNGVDGDIILSLADVPDEGGGVLQKTEFDSKGRKTGTSEATTDDLEEGILNLYLTEDRVIEAVGGLEMQLDGTMVQYRWRDDLPWVDAVDLAPIAGGGGGGAPVELRNDGTWIQWREVGTTTWYNLILVSDLQGPPGADGVAGADGKSAYQVALDDGFVGTEAEWLESLKGPPGADSTVPGPPGADGNDAVGAAVRGVVNFTTGTGTIAVGKVSLLIHLMTDAPGRVRLYSTASARDADAGRAANVAAPQGAGLLLEFISTGTLLGAPLTPGVIAHNEDAVPTGVVYYNVQPTGGSSNVALTYLKLET